MGWRSLGRRKTGDSTGREWGLLYLSDRFDHVFIQRDKVSLFFPVDQHIGQRDEEYRFIVKEIRHAITHGGNKQISRVGTQCSPDPDLCFFPEMHHSYLDVNRQGLVPTTGKFHTTTKFLMLMLSHFFSPLLHDTRHSGSFPSLFRKENVVLFN